MQRDLSREDRYIKQSDAQANPEIFLMVNCSEDFEQFNSFPTKSVC
jgi:hypothetical protein